MQSGIDREGIPVSEMLEDVRAELTAENALDRLRLFACPECGTTGQFETFRSPNNNAIGLRCRSCEERHPFKPTIMWLRQTPPKRSNDIQTVMAQRGYYCWLCSARYEALQERGIGMHVHHTLPFAYEGDKVEKIPLCALCHEIASAVQRHQGRLLNEGTE